MARYKIEDIEGIGPAIGEKLRAAGIASTEALLEICRTQAQRAALAEKTGLSESQLLKFTNMADLYRINGIGSEYSELLEAAGVDTVPELANRNAANLAQALATANTAKNLTRRAPALVTVSKWIEQAKSLSRVIEY
ncbi:MAG: DUF4332 domain-containing protein [Burkholderiales bacterium]